MFDKSIFLDLSSLPRNFHTSFNVMEAGIISSHPSETLVRDDTLEICIRLNSAVPLSHDVMDNTVYELPFPNICLKCPGVRQEIRVDGKRDAFFMKYSIHLLDAMKEAGFISPPYCWPVTMNSGFLQIIGEFEELAPRICNDGIGDRIDLLGMRFWTEALLARRASDPPSGANRIAHIVNWLNIHYLEPIDWNALFLEHGFSRRTFFRLWEQQMTVSPAALLLDLRLEYARRLLVGSDIPVWRIANNIYIQSPSYFSRLVFKKYGMTPQEIRNQR